MRKRNVSAGGMVGMVALILCVASALRADTVSWRHATLRVDNNWDSTTLNWQGQDTTYADGDDVVFNNDIVVDAGTVNIVADVSPGSVTFFGQRNSSWTITGADILGAPVISVGYNRAVNFTGGNATVDYSFTGGITASAAVVTYSPGTGAAVAHSFGTNAITIDNGGTFLFNPTDTGDTLTNNLIVGSGGAKWDNRNTGSTAVMSGTVTMNGNLTMTYGGVHKYFEQDAVLTGNRTIITAGRWHHIGSANIDGGGTCDLTVRNGGTNADWYTYLEGSGVGISTTSSRESDATNKADLWITDVAPNTFFSGVTGDVIHRGGGLRFNSSSIDVDFSLILEESTYGGGPLGTRLVNVTALNVQSGGSIGGDTRYANGYTGDMTVTVADGGAVAPGLSIGTMTVVGTLILNDTSQLNFEFNGTESDTIAVIGTAGDLTLDGVLNLLDAPVLGQVYTLFTYTGDLTDHGLVLGSTPLPYAGLKIFTGEGQVQIQWVPEPGTCLLASLGLLLMVRRRQRSGPVSRA